MNSIDMDQVSKPSRRALYFLFALLLLCANAQASEYTSLGITRDQVKRAMTDAGLDLTFNQYPPVDGEPYDEAIVRSPFMQIGMFGPDDGLKTISLSLRPSTDARESFRHGFVSLWIMTAAFPNWEEKEEWLNHTIRSMADGSIKGKVEFERDGRSFEAAMSGGYWFMEVSGVQPKEDPDTSVKKTTLRPIEEEIEVLRGEIAAVTWGVALALRVIGGADNDSATMLSIIRQIEGASYNGDDGLWEEGINRFKSQLLRNLNVDPVKETGE